MVSNQAVGAIARASALSLSAAEFAEQFQTPGTPVILTDLFDPSVDWNLDYLCQQLDVQEFLLRFYGNERYKQDKRLWTSIGSGIQPKQMSFKDYAELLHSREAHEHDVYLAKCSIVNTPLAKTQAMGQMGDRLHTIGFHSPASDFNLWVGPGGHVECLHYDPTDGVLVQMHGTKRVVLFPPSQTPNLYPFPIHVHLRYGLKLRCWFSQVYPDTPDLEAFPRFESALQDRYEILLHPGEALYIPAGWWHEVTAVDDQMVCSINRFWRVYPTRRAIAAWTRWRAHLGSLCAIPYTVWSLMAATSQGRGRQKLREILQML